MAVNVKGVSEYACTLHNTILKQERFKPRLNGRIYCRGLQSTASDVHKPHHPTQLLTATIIADFGA